MKTMTIKTDRCRMDEVLSAVKAAGSVLLFSHISADGDTLGSALALKLRLERMGKRARLFLDGDVPANLAFLTEYGTVEKPDETANADCAIAVDVSCYDRLGACETLFDACPVRLLIDHHGTNEGFAQVNLIDGEAPATALVLYRLFEQMDMPLTREEAVCLYTALSTDTGNFVYESTNPESFRMMGALMEAGLPLAEYSRLLFRRKELPFVKLLGLVLPSLRLACEGKVAGLSLTLEQQAAAGAQTGHTDGIVDYAIDLAGVEMAYFAREVEGGKVKVSLRSLEPYHVDAVAARFGGGGHKLASGLTVEMSLEQAIAQVEQALQEAYRSAQ